ncbi:MAG: HAD family hydrolase [Anaerolineae bacterium]|nr:HAD family hydrolase [Anaerolineae bacterium]
MLSIAGQTLDPRLIIFDKDGTLIAFDLMWKTWYAHLIGALRQQVPFSATMERALAETLGAGSEEPSCTDGEWDPDGPLTLASTGEVRLLIAGIIYRYGHRTWSEALRSTQQAEGEARAALEGYDLLQPIGPLRELFERLAQAGILLAIATADDRRPTEDALARLGIASLCAAWVCGDDGIPLKPAPDMVLKICHDLQIAPEDTIIVGDTVSDLEMGRSAGCGWVAAVTSGALRREHLAPYADLVIPDIHAIEILSP